MTQSNGDMSKPVDDGFRVISYDGVRAGSRGARGIKLRVVSLTVLSVTVCSTAAGF